MIPTNHLTLPQSHNFQLTTSIIPPSTHMISMPVSWSGVFFFAIFCLFFLVYDNRNKNIDHHNVAAI